MSKSLLDLSGKIDPALVEVFVALAGVAAARHIRYFVVGATARDMILSYGHGIAIKRATADIDLGVEVADWEEFHALQDGLVATGQFEPMQSAQRLLAEEHPDLLADDDFDYERAGARLLGRDMATVMSPETRKVVLEILDRETDNPERFRLVEDMMDNYAINGDAFEECLQFLNALKAGIQEG